MEMGWQFGVWVWHFFCSFPRLICRADSLFVEAFPVSDAGPCYRHMTSAVWRARAAPLPRVLSSLGRAARRPKHTARRRRFAGARHRFLPAKFLFHPARGRPARVRDQSRGIARPAAQATMSLSSRVWPICQSDSPPGPVTAPGCFSAAPAHRPARPGCDIPTPPATAVARDRGRPDRYGAWLYLFAHLPDRIGPLHHLFVRLKHLSPTWKHLFALRKHLFATLKRLFPPRKCLFAPLQRLFGGLSSPFPGRNAFCASAIPFGGLSSPSSSGAVITFLGACHHLFWACHWMTAPLPVLTGPKKAMTTPLPVMTGGEKGDDSPSAGDDGLKKAMTGPLPVMTGPKKAMTAPLPVMTAWKGPSPDRRQAFPCAKKALPPRERVLRMPRRLKRFPGGGAGPGFSF